MKKIVSILLAVMLVASLAITASASHSVYTDEFTTTADDAIKEYEDANGTTVETNKYFFQMPNGSNGPLATEDVTYTEIDEETGDSRDILVCNAGEKAPSWYNEYTEGAGVYWWGSAPANCETVGWAGYRAMVEDADQCIFYVNMPAQVVCFDWNNGVDGGMDKTDPIYYKAAQTVDVPSEYPDPGELTTMPEGADSFDNCIYIINPDKVDVNPLSKKMTCGGDWYFYYGNGCYGEYATDSANFTSIEDNCVNPDHYDAEGKHVGFQGGEPQKEYLRGDYDQDGKITIMDATRAQNILAKLYVEEDEDMLVGVDADGDGKLSIMDATRIQNVLAKIKNMDGTDYVAA